MSLQGLISRTIPPAAWAEGENIPWNDPDFSERMLAEHLSQDHNLASRRFEIIDRQVQWIHEGILRGTPTRVLDLACGPGLYTSRLARRGHECVGIDYAPASIRYAQETATCEKLACTYRLADVRGAEYGKGYGLVMMLFGQLNVFRKADARAVLAKAYSSLAPGGLLLLESQRFATVEKNGRAGNSWYSCGEGGGLFSNRPHLCLCEAAWDAAGQATTQRFFIVDGLTGEVTRHAMTTQAYTDEESCELLTDVGFESLLFFPSLVGTEVEEESQSANLVVVGRKRAASADAGRRDEEMTKRVREHTDGSECPEGTRRVPHGFKPCCEEFERRTYACYHDIRYEWWPRLKSWVIIIAPEAGGGGIAFGFCPHCGVKLTPYTKHGRRLDAHK